MVGDEVEDDAQAPALGIGKQVLEIVQAAEQWIDIPVVRDIVAEVLHWTFKERGYPQRIHAKALEISELAPDPHEIANAVSIGIGEASWIDLIENRVLPPLPQIEPPVSSPTSITISRMAWDWQARRKPTGL